MDISPSCLVPLLKLISQIGGRRPAEGAALGTQEVSAEQWRRAGRRGRGRADQRGGRQTPHTRLGRTNQPYFEARTWRSSVASSEFETPVLSTFWSE